MLPLEEDFCPLPDVMGDDNGVDEGGDLFANGFHHCEGHTHRAYIDGVDNETNYSMRPLLLPGCSENRRIEEHPVPLVVVYCA